MIASISDTGGNGAPLLDENRTAVDNLRKLHGALGDLLAAADTGQLDDELGQGFAADAARYAKRAAKALRDDPMPYIASGLLNSVLWACGVPGVGAFLGGIAQNIRGGTSPIAQARWYRLHPNNAVTTTSIATHSAIATLASTNARLARPSDAA